MKNKIYNFSHGKCFLILLLIWIFGESMACSMGTDNKNLTEKPINKLGLNTDKMFLEGSKTEIDNHPKVENNKTILRKIVLPPKVKDKWQAVKILIQNKQNEERGKIKIIKLGASINLNESGLKVTVGPFLPNFMMDKVTYTSMGNEELNPAVQLIVEENGKIIYKGWVFKNFPTMYAFEHQQFSIKLLGAVPIAVS